jgi:rubrerythrin
MNPMIYDIGDPSGLQEWAEITANRIANDPEFQEELLRGSDYSLKRLRTPEPDLGAGPSQWTAESEDPDGSDLHSRRTKRRRTIEEGETGDRAAAQRGETQEPRVRRTPANQNDTSKLGNQGLRSETHVVPSQGVYRPLSLGPAITEATLGPTELRDQAWREGGQGISEVTEVTEDAHDEEETDEERWARLMYREGGRWRCRGCDGRAFSDRSTLQRHCRSSAHAKQRDMRKCPLCEKSYRRQSGLNRHLKVKHA